MYQNLGIHWASSVPAFLAAACLPAPFLLYKYGAAIRAQCPYAAKFEAVGGQEDGDPDDYIVSPEKGEGEKEDASVE